MGNYRPVSQTGNSWLFYGSSQKIDFISITCFLDGMISVGDKGKLII